MDGERAGSGSRARLDRDPPLIAGRIHGVRTWSLMWTADGGLALTGYIGSAWEPGGRTTVAKCIGDAGTACSHAPAPACGCGLYARHPFADEARQLRFGPPDQAESFGPFSEVDVAGVVEAWGRVELHEGGFRAEFARPLAIVVLEEWRDGEYAALVRRLAARYRAEVVCLQEPRELAAWCERHQLGLAEHTVRTLVRERPRPYRVPAGRAPEPIDDRTRSGWVSELWEEWRPESIGDALATLVAGAFGLLYLAFGAAIVFGIAAAIFGWFPEENRAPSGHRPALHGKRSLEILDEELVRDGKRRLLYLATVKNTGDRTAIGVVPSGRLLDRSGERIESIDRPGKVEGDANLAPREAGVVWDVVRVRGRERRDSAPDVRMKVHAGASRLTDGPRRPPVVVRDVRSDRDLCIVTATVDSRHAMSRARLAVVGRDRKGRALGVDRLDIGPLSRGRDRYFVTRIPPWACRRPGLRLEAHASLTRRQLLGRRGVQPEPGTPGVSSSQRGATPQR